MHVSKVCIRMLMFILLLSVAGECYCFAPDQETETQQADTFSASTHSPRLATLLSLALPGAGQIYNQKYWKAPIVWGGLFITYQFIVLNQNNYKVFDRSYNHYLANDITAVASELDKLRFSPFSNKQDNRGEERVEVYDTQLKDILYQGRRDYERLRNLSYIATGLIYFLNVIDATVDAHFFDFNVSEDISMRLDPAILNNHFAGIQCRITFN